MASVRKTVLEARADERGWVVDPIVPPFPEEHLGQAHIASLEPGSVRGNHVHPGKAEYVFVWGGATELVWKGDDGRVVRERVGPDELVVFEIPAGVAHAVVNVGDERAYLLAYYLGDAGRRWPVTERSELV